MSDDIAKEDMGGWIVLRRIPGLDGVEYRCEGVTGLAHVNRGRTPVNKLDPVVASEIVHLAASEYKDFNDGHLTEVQKRPRGKSSLGSGDSFPPGTPPEKTGHRPHHPLLAASQKTR